MKIETLNIDSIEEGDFLYRYVDAEKLIDFLSLKRIILPKMNMMSDKQEGIGYRLIELNLKLEKTSKKSEMRRLQKEIQKETRWIEDFKEHNSISCWNLSRTELMSHWSIYGKAGYVIKINAFDMINFLKKIDHNSIGGNAIMTTNNFTVNLGMIDYCSFSENFDSRATHQAFIKNESYGADKEFRINISLNPTQIEVNNKNSKVRARKLLLSKPKEKFIVDVIEFNTLPRIRFEWSDFPSLEIFSNPISDYFRRNAINKMISSIEGIPCDFLVKQSTLVSFL